MDDLCFLYGSILLLLTKCFNYKCFHEIFASVPSSMRKSFKHQTHIIVSTQMSYLISHYYNDWNVFQHGQVSTFMTYRAMSKELVKNYPKKYPGKREKHIWKIWLSNWQHRICLINLCSRNAEERDAKIFLSLNVGS